MKIKKCAVIISLLCGSGLSGGALATAYTTPQTGENLVMRDGDSVVVADANAAIDSNRGLTIGGAITVDATNTYYGIAATNNQQVGIPQSLSVDLGSGTSVTVENVMDGNSTSYNTVGVAISNLFNTDLHIEANDLTIQITGTDTRPYPYGFSEVIGLSYNGARSNAEAILNGKTAITAQGMGSTTTYGIKGSWVTQLIIADNSEITVRSEDGTAYGIVQFTDAGLPAGASTHTDLGSGANVAVTSTEHNAIGISIAGSDDSDVQSTFNANQLTVTAISQENTDNYGASGIILNNIQANLGENTHIIAQAKAGHVYGIQLSETRNVTDISQPSLQADYLMIDVTGNNHSTGLIVYGVEGSPTPTDVNIDNSSINVTGYSNGSGNIYGVVQEDAAFSADNFTVSVKGTSRYSNATGISSSQNSTVTLAGLVDIQAVGAQKNVALQATQGGKFKATGFIPYKGI